MALRLARGLFRLWLVLSVLWIGAVGVYEWWTLPAGSLQQALIWGPCEGPPTPPDELQRAPWLIAQCEDVRSASLLALLPPAFAFALGSALVWALRGFR
jgi:hypothetical protein